VHAQALPVLNLHKVQMGSQIPLTIAEHAMQMARNDLLFRRIYKRFSRKQLHASMEV
jgi:hypothetical protein